MGSPKKPKEPPEPHESRRIGWYPGHMRKAGNQLAEAVGQCQLVIEIRDARLPMASTNHQIDSWLGGRPRILLFNKTSLADPHQTAEWKKYFKQMGVPVLFSDNQDSSLVKTVSARVIQLTQSYKVKFESRGIRPPLPKVMVVGLPNVGKSTLINRLAGKKRQLVTPTPGTTRGLNWVVVQDKFLLLDSPGLMDPTPQNEKEGLQLTLIGAIPDHISRPVDSALYLVDWILKKYPQLAMENFGADQGEAMNPHDILFHMAKTKGWITKGGAPDMDRASKQFLGDFREGKLGKMTLEWMEEGVGKGN